MFFYLVYFTCFNFFLMVDIIMRRGNENNKKRIMVDWEVPTYTPNVEWQCLSN